jgi:predicted transposase/invertase (TIGR01784 family)
MQSETKKLIQFDWAIKTLLREKANFPILEGFLSELLDTDVKIDSLLESESNKAHSKDRSNRVDVLAQLGNGEKVIIEVQCERQWDFLSRMLYGVSKVVVEHLEQGEAYGKIPRVISVNIVYFNLGHGEDYIYRGTTQFHGLHKKDTLQLSQKEREHYPPHIDHLSHIFPEYYVLKVSGFDLKIRDTLDEWIYTLKEAEVKPEFSAKGIHQAAQKLAVLNLSQEERVAYDRHVGDARISRSTLESSFVDGLHQGITQGLAQGITQGIAQGKERMIRSMHQLGIPLEQIATAAEHSLEEVKDLLEHSK